MGSTADIVEKTYYWDRIRGAAQGVLETGYAGLALIIAIEVFDASSTVKSWIVAAHPIGHLMAPLTLGFFAWLKLPANKVARALLISSGLCFISAALTTSLTSYVLLLILAGILVTQIISMVTHIYAENYPPDKRGTYLSSSLRYSVVSTLVFSILFGQLLDLDKGYYTFVLAGLAMASIIAGLAIGKMPSSAVHKESAQNPLRSMSYAFSDWKFGIMLFSWMFAGLGNLLVMPLRFEYLIQPEFGIEASYLLVAWITLGLPAICRFAFVKFWGRLFDSIDFMVLRMILSAIQMISILLFFSTKNIWILGFANALNGFAMGGGGLSWNLWVTKFATRKRTAAYMSVHSFLTGIRGFAAPFLGFFLLTAYGSQSTGAIASGMILISIILILMLFLSLRNKTPQIAVNQR